MAYRVSAIIFNELSADPGTPSEGQVWYNTTTDEFKGYANGATVVFSTAADLAAHVAASNPHGVTLEEARTADNAVSGTIAMGGNAITGVADPSADQDAATLAWVIAQIKQRLQGLDWQGSVLDKDLATPPGGPVTGDRYIVAAAATGAWSGQDDNIAEWDGTAWEFTTPTEGAATRVEDENKQYIYDGATWGVWDATVDHGALIGLGDDDHTQYFLVSGGRAMTGALDMGSNNITNAGTVNGVTVEDGIHDNVAGEIAAVALKASPVNGDIILIEDSADSNNKKRATLGSLPGGGGGGGLDTKSGVELESGFSGTPMAATITFSGAFSDANYSVALTCLTTGNTVFTPVISAQTASSFTVDLGTNDKTGLTSVYWTAIAHGET